MKAYVDKDTIRVDISKQEVMDFRSRWPVSGLPKRGISIGFDMAGDVVKTAPYRP